MGWGNVAGSREDGYHGSTWVTEVGELIVFGFEVQDHICIAFFYDV